MTTRLPVLGLLALASAPAAQTPAPEVFDAAVAHIRTHPRLHRYLTPEEMDAELDAARAQLDEGSSDAELVLAIQRALHLVAEGHNGLQVPLGTAPRNLVYPVRFDAMGGQLRLFAIHPSGPWLDEELLGARVVGWGGLPWDDVLARLLPFTSADNEHGAIAGELWELLESPRLAHALGLTDDQLVSIVELETLDGAARTVPLEAVAPIRSGWTNVTLPTGPEAQLARRRPRDPHWFEVLDGGVVYAQYNQVNRGEPSIADFAEELDRALRDSNADKLIVDVRRNGGGDNHGNPPLMHAILKNERINRPGHLFVLIGPGTYSAAINFCGWMERETHAIFVGEPTGSPPNMAGDSASLTLDREGWTLHVSQWPWNESMPWDRRLWIHPHVVAPTTLPDVLAGRDPAIEAALAFSDPELEEWLATTQLRRHYTHASQTPAAEARTSWPIRDAWSRITEASTAR